MMKRVFQLMVALVLLVATFGSVGGAAAWSGCSTYVTVQWGDTLAKAPNRAARPFVIGQQTRLGWRVYTGQCLYAQDTPLILIIRRPAVPTLCNMEIRWGKLPDA
jgi:hypothetical protein